MLYSTYGGDWVYGSRITYSFAPDGTSIGGTPSILFQTLNAKFTQANWQLQFQKAAAVWQAVANIKLSQVTDDGSPAKAVAATSRTTCGSATSGSSWSTLGSGVLGETFLPPPYNGGTDAGDMFLNSTVKWQIGSSGYDLETVAIHEFGHALGLGESTITSACMYAYYNGVKRRSPATTSMASRDLGQAPARPVQRHLGTCTHHLGHSQHTIAANNTATVTCAANNQNPNRHSQSISPPH